MAKEDECIECAASLFCVTGTHFDVVTCYQREMLICVSVHSSNKGERRETQ